MTPSESELYRRVDEVLYYVWDPIGVATNPANRDEYENYLPKVFMMLQEGENASSLASYLESIVTKDLGLGADLKRSLRVAEVLLDWQDRLTSQRSRHS